MSKILKLMKLDFSLVKPYMKTIFIVFLSPLLVMYTLRDIIGGTIFSMCMMAMTCNYTFSVAEKNDLGRLYGLLPVSKSDIVNGKFLFVGLQGVIMTIFSVAINSLMLILLNVKFGIGDVIIGISVGIAMYYFFTAIQLPFYFKFGGIKGKFFAFIPFIGIFFIGEIAKRIKPGQLAKASSIAIINNPYALLAMSILLSAILYGISVGITEKIYSRMEL